MFYFSIAPPASDMAMPDGNVATTFGNGYRTLNPDGSLSAIYTYRPFDGTSYGSTTQYLVTLTPSGTSFGQPPSWFKAGLTYNGTSLDGRNVIAIANNSSNVGYLFRDGVPTTLPVVLHGGLAGVNNAGAVVGKGLINGVVQSFVYQDGAVTPIVMAGSIMGQTAYASLNGGTVPTSVPENQTYVGGINDRGDIVGFYLDHSMTHGFLKSGDSIQTVDVPGAAWTRLSGINDAGQIIGQYGNSTADLTGSTFVAQSDGYHVLCRGINAWVSDQTHPAIQQLTMTPDDGPTAVVGDIMQITPDNLNITSVTPDLFLHSGSGDDAIDVHGAGGNNILDGSTGSNFLVGGAGHDTFFVDDRGPARDIWSTVVGFHSGDAATFWGITPQDFGIKMSDGQGAVGYTGLTILASAADHPNASVTLAGFSNADVTSGRLSVSYGRTDDLPGLAGSSYMQIAMR